jgi:hypothetical protein
MEYLYKRSAIIENTPEMIEWLEQNGYRLSSLFSNKGDNLFTSKCGVYGTFNNMFITEYTSHEHVIGGRIDCRNNPELFKQIVIEKI